MKKNEGWAVDITSKNKNHYYKDGVSLCKRAFEKGFFINFSKEIGYINGGDCSICVNKQKL